MGLWFACLYVSRGSQFEFLLLISKPPESSGLGLASSSLNLNFPQPSLSVQVIEPQMRSTSEVQPKISTCMQPRRSLNAVDRWEPKFANETDLKRERERADLRHCSTSHQIHARHGDRVFRHGHGSNNQRDGPRNGIEPRNHNGTRVEWILRGGLSSVDRFTFACCLQVKSDVQQA